MSCARVSWMFYDLYNLAQKRRFERYQYALKVLERPMDFTGNDTFNLDRSKAPWPKDEAELNALWDGKVKFDELSLKLTGKSDKEIRETLTRRYKFAIRRLAQTNSEDVFSLAMTALRVKSTHIRIIFLPAIPSSLIPK